MFFGFARGGTVGGFIGFILGYIVEEMLNGNIQVEKNDPFKTQKHSYNTYQKKFTHFNI
jgi:membrane protein YqaA with SNARE-associated domain